MRWSLTTIVFVLATGCGSSTTQTATAQATTTEASSTPAPPEPEVTEPAEPTCPSETTEWVYFPLFLRFGRESAELEEEHMEEVRFPGPPPRRDEFRAVCDRHDNIDDILSDLENGV